MLASKLWPERGLRLQIMKSDFNSHKRSTLTRTLRDLRRLLERALVVIPYCKKLRKADRIAFRFIFLFNLRYGNPFVPALALQKVLLQLEKLAKDVRSIISAKR